MKKLIRKIGLSLLSTTILCLNFGVLILIFNGIGHIISNVLGDALELTSESFMDYFRHGAVAMLILFIVVMIFIVGCFIILRFATRYNEKKKEPLECPYDLKSCDQLDTSGMSKIDCEDCPRY